MELLKLCFHYKYFMNGNIDSSSADLYRKYAILTVRVYITAREDVTLGNWTKTDYVTRLENMPFIATAARIIYSLFSNPIIAEAHLA